jgi:hypothetical protein
VIVAESEIEGSATLVAVTVTVCGVVMLAGAVYRPEDDIVPVAEDKDQLTEVLLALVIVDVNWALCPAAKLAVAGVTEIEIVGTKLIVAEADCVVSLTLVALTVMV